MSSIITPVSYKPEDAKGLIEKLSAHLGINRLAIKLKTNETINGIISELGKDYLIVMGDACETIIPIENILYIQYTP